MGKENVVIYLSTYIYTYTRAHTYIKMEYYLAIKRRIDEPEDITLIEISQTRERQMLYELTYR